MCCPYKLADALATVILALCLHQLPWLPWSAGQRLPSRDEEHFRFQIDHEELFWDTKLIPDGVEVSAFLKKDKVSRFFFLVEEEGASTLLSVTPCGSKMSWNVTYQDWFEEEPSGGGSEESDYSDAEELQVQRAAVRSPRDKATHRVLGSYSGYGAHAYFSDQAFAGLYTLEIKAEDSDNTVRLLGTSSPHSDAPYPVLPDDPNVRVMSVTRTSVQLAWKASPTASRHHQPLHYCIMANTQRNFKTECAANAYMNGDAPPTAPPHAGFGFSWEKERFRPVSKHPLPTADPSDVFYTCVGTKTHYSFNGAAPGKLYYFDVFAFNTERNISTTYVGTAAKTKSRSKVINLKDGKVQQAYLKRSSPKKVFKFSVTKDESELLLSIQPCSGKVIVEVSDSSHVLEKTKITSLEQFSYSNASAGQYTITIVGGRRQSTSLYVYATTRPEKNPYPFLPTNLTIKVHDKMTTCNSTTVSWYGTPRRQQYCLFIHRHRRSDSWVYKRQNTCVDPKSRKKSEKVACRWYRARGKRRGRSFLTEEIRGLRPGRKYVLDVYVRRAGGQALAYQRAWVTTRSQC